MFLLFVFAVGQTGGRGFVDDAQDLQPRDGARVFRRLALGVRKVSGDGDDRLLHRFAQVVLRVALQFLQNHRGDLLGSVLFVVDGDAVVRSHFALDGDNRPIRVHDGLALGQLAHQALSFLGEGHHRRSGSHSLRVCDDGRLIALLDGDAAVCRSQINSYHFRHDVFLLKFDFYF